MLWTLLLAMLPQLTYFLILRLGRFSPPSWPGRLVSLASGCLWLGALFTAMEQAEGKEKSLSGLFFRRRGGMLKKALLLTLLLGVVNLLLTLLPNLLIQYGASLTEQARGTAEPSMWVLGRPYRPIENWDLYSKGEMIGNCGMILLLAETIVEGILLFPVKYRFLVHPERPVWEQLLAGVKLGAQCAGEILAFQFRLWLPVCAGFGLLALFSRTAVWARLVLPAAGAAAAAWYVPYMILAQVLFGKNLIEKQGRKLPPPPPKKRMKLIQKDGWCRCDMKSGAVKKGMAPSMEKERTG